MRLFYTILFIALCVPTFAQKKAISKKMFLPITGFEKNNNRTATYEETIAFYKTLAQEPIVELLEYGSTDSGRPLHLAVLSLDADFDPVSIKEEGKLILFVNNAIHPGEPCGVDATMMLFRDLAKDKSLQGVLKNIVLVAVPFYNIGGGLNRNSHSRANQVGPEAYGFRGNAKNLDLNRDFVKCDSKNAITFNQLFQEWLPDIFIDNHTSNGADYPYTMTLISTQHDKLDPNLAEYLDKQLIPNLYTDMAAKRWEMTPYVYSRDTPDTGIAAFLDLPRYSSGYAVLHNCISFIPETHMLKPYNDRVLSTYEFMVTMLENMDKDVAEIKAAKEQAIAFTKSRTAFDLNWELDMDRAQKITFKGYEAKYKRSVVTGLKRLYYDQTEPFEKEIPYLKHYKATVTVQKPIAYIIPQAYSEIVDRLCWNGVEVKRLTEDQVLNLEMYKIGDFKTTDYAYEGHYLHSKVEVETLNQPWRYYEGDYVVFVNQASNRYIVETLEPQGADSFFAWNFFDGILMQKEHYSSYVFEDLAAKFLKQNPDVKTALEEKKAADPEFAKDSRAQLDFVYKRSPHYEPTHRLYPVGRLVNDASIKCD